MEQKILQACCLSKVAFTAATKLDVSSTLSKPGQLFLEELKVFYEKDPTAKQADAEVVQDRLKEKYPRHEVFSAITEGMESVSVPNIVAQILLHKRRILREELQAALSAGATDAVVDELYAKIKEVANFSMTEENGSVVNLKSVEEIVARNTGENLITFDPPELNKALGGGLLPGHHLLVFARPDAGKTTTALSFVRSILKQGKKVLYIGNEDPEDDVLLRVCVSLSGKPKEYIQEHKTEIFEFIRDKRNYGNFYFKEMWPGTLAEIEALVAEIRPHVLIVDQARNISTGKDNRTQELEIIERSIRNMGKRYSMLTISFTQAGDSGDNKAVLQMGDVDSSNTGMQASADVMVGVGCTHDLEQRGIRVLSFPKNKRGDKTPIQVIFNKELQRLE